MHRLKGNFTCLVPLHFPATCWVLRCGPSLLRLHAGTQVSGFKNLGFRVLQILCFQNSNFRFQRGTLSLTWYFCVFLSILLLPPFRRPARLQAPLLEGRLQQVQVSVTLDSLYSGIFWASKQPLHYANYAWCPWQGVEGGASETHSSSKIKLFLGSEREADLSIYGLF